MGLELNTSPGGFAATTALMLVVLVLWMGFPSLFTFTETKLPPPGTTTWQDKETICWEVKVCCDDTETNCSSWTDCEYTRIVEKLAPELVDNAYEGRPDGDIIPRRVH